MKKNIVFIILILPFLPLSAQDTIRYGDSNYYFGIMNYNSHHYGVSVKSPWYNPDRHDTCAFVDFGISQALGHSYITHDSLIVYGLAIAYDTTYNWHYTSLAQYPIAQIYQYHWDTTYQNETTHGSLTLLQESDFVSNIRQLEYRANVLNCSYDPESGLHYRVIDSTVVVTDEDIVSYVPVYEYYFDNPVTVHDTFFIGVKTDVDYGDGDIILIACRYMMYSEAPIPIYEYIMGANMGVNQNLSHIQIHPRYARLEYGGFYPIIRPLRERDTTMNDSTAIAAVDYGSRVSLAPNPTDGRFTVTSDDELRAIAVYDMTGRAVMRLNASGSRAEIDATKLPKGCYVLAATTTTGIARKKLVLR